MKNVHIVHGLPQLQPDRFESYKVDTIPLFPRSQSLYMMNDCNQNKSLLANQSLFPIPMFPRLQTHETKSPGMIKGSLNSRNVYATNLNQENYQNIKRSQDSIWEYEASKSCNIKDLIQFKNQNEAMNKNKYGDDEESSETNLLDNSRRISKKLLSHQLSEKNEKALACYKYPRLVKNTRTLSSKLRSRRNPWKPSEDVKLLELIGVYGECWAMISSKMPNRTGKQIRDRFLNILRPNLKKGDWTQSEDNLLVTLYYQLGHKWSLIAKHLPGRSEAQVKNRFYSHMKKELNSAFHNKYQKIDDSIKTNNLVDDNEMINFDKENKDLEIIENAKSISILYEPKLEAKLEDLEPKLEYSLSKIEDTNSSCLPQRTDYSTSGLILSQWNSKDVSNDGIIEAVQEKTLLERQLNYEKRQLAKAREQRLKREWWNCENSELLNKPDLQKQISHKDPLNCTNIFQIHGLEEFRSHRNQTNSGERSGLNNRTINNDKKRTNIEEVNKTLKEENQGNIIKDGEVDMVLEILANHYQNCEEITSEELEDQRYHQLNMRRAKLEFLLSRTNAEMNNIKKITKVS